MIRTGISLLFLFLDAKRGFTGEGEKHPEITGVPGAIHEMAFQAMMGSLVEGGVTAGLDALEPYVPPGRVPERGERGVDGIIDEVMN